MGMSTGLLKLAVMTLAVSTANAAFAQWQLDSSASTLAFISTKNATVSEVHSFSRISGSIGAAGEAELEIELDSVETLIPIRNERMRELLFQTAEFPAAQVSAQIDPALIERAVAGEVLSMALPLTLSLHGHERTLQAPVTVVALDGQLLVTSSKPLIVGAGDFALAEGIVKLREVAGLASISTAVPVTVNLIFSADK